MMIKKIDKRPVVLRLDAVSRPVTEEERNILSLVEAEIIEIEDLKELRESEADALLQKADAVMVTAKDLTGDDIEKLNSCRVISRMGIGVDKIDVNRATQKGILISNLPGFCTEEVADHTMALLLATARRLKEYESCMKKGFRPSSPYDSEMHRLSSSVLGIVGFGAIGKAVAQRARGFNMTILACDPSLSEKRAADFQVKKADFEELLAESDFLVLVCPLTPETREMMKAEQFSMMKPSAALINTGRGGLVNEQDLYDALKHRVIRFAALDVFQEIDVFDLGGFSPDYRFLKLDNVLLTPHVAASSVEMVEEQRRRGAYAVVDVLSGRWPENIVNTEVVPWFAVGAGEKQNEEVY